MTEQEKKERIIYLQHKAAIAQISREESEELDQLTRDPDRKITNTNIWARDLAEDYTIEQIASLYD